MKLVLSVDAIRYPLTGVGRYTDELARALALLPDMDILYLQGTRLTASLPAPGRGSAAEPWLRDRLSGYALPTEIYRQWRQAMRTRALRGHEQRLFHGANYYVPPFGGRSVVTVHDASVCVDPSYHRADRVRFMRKEVVRSLRRAAMVVTVSDFSRREIATHWGVPMDRIRVTPLAARADFRPRTAAEIGEPLRAWGLTAGAYCLFVGTVEPRKNLGALLDAYAGLPTGLRMAHPLVLAGHQGWNSEAIHDRIAAATRAGWLRYLGFVADNVLPALVAGARLFVYPSLYEGFGLPVLEAMAAGIPVVCSDAAALPEVAGDAAALCDPADIGRLRTLIARGLEDEAWLAAARARGLVRAAQFSWARCARQTAAIYTEVTAN